jgi:hypothetical protein
MRESSRKKEATILALVSYPTIREACQVAGVSEATVYRWLQDPTFERDYRIARTQVVRKAIAALQGVCADAVTVLKSIMLDASNAASPRIAAAKAVLELSIKAVEIDDLQARVEALEAQSSGRTA